MAPSIDLRLSVGHDFLSCTIFELFVVEQYRDKVSSTKTRSYLRSLCEQVKKAHMQKKSKEIYDGVRRITGKRAPQVRVIKDKNGKVLTAVKIS